MIPERMEYGVSHFPMLSRFFLPQTKKIYRLRSK